MTDAFKGGFTFKRGDGAPTEAFATLEEVRSVSGFGKTNELIDVTNFDSTNNTKEYIAGMADGAEVTIECNRDQDGTQQNALITDVDNQTTRNFQIAWTDGTTAKQYDFAAVCMSYQYQPAFSDANKITYTIKISGDITVT